MYARFFGLTENPFGLPPDPRYLYLSRRHQEALAHLTYGVTEGGGFVVLSGEVGTGKTLMIRALIERLPQHVDAALVLYPMLSVREFVASICDDLGVKYPRNSDSLKVLIDALNEYLLKNHSKGRRTVLIIDEAHKLSHEVLEQIRLLTNLETSKEKLLQIILIGQPELDALLAQPHLRQLAQRVTARYVLSHLSPAETNEYVRHRLHVAGGGPAVFSAGALYRLHRLSGGVPRLINVIADRALLGAYAHGHTEVSGATVQRAAREVVQAPSSAPFARRMALAALVLVVVAIGVWTLGPVFTERLAAPAATPATAASTRAPSLAERLSNPQAKTETDTAFGALLARWQIDGRAAPANANGCVRAASVGLRCFTASGNWNHLRNHDRPAILELIDTQGNRHHVLLTSLDNDGATLAFGDETQRVALTELEQYWYGKYLLLWRAPFAETPALRVGMSDPAVGWMREALGRALGLNLAAGVPETFDAALDNAVRDFQRRHRLPDDGVVGNLTWLQLSLYDARTDSPHLRTTGAL